MVKLGDKVKDTVTGFTGTATARIEYLNGCVQFLVMPKMATPKRGETPKHPEDTYIDIEQLEVVGGRKKIKSEPRGGGVRKYPD